ncbi:MAG: peptide chain release factor 1 [Deltaproteobacteria bacterium]|nr:MAG: peptide chain release factor 1 [Deltaproteobacteria bacterium]
MSEQLRVFEQRLEALNTALMDPALGSDVSRLRRLSKEHAHVSQIVEVWQDTVRLEAELTETREMASEESDPEMRALVRAEITSLEEQLDARTKELKLLLLPQDPHEGRPILLEIRAGTGGDEAALFAADLYRMYSRFGEAEGLSFDVLSSSEISVAGSAMGFKEIIASVSGDNAYKLLRFESGVHRVQRVPATESQGRIHTSAATVAVMPEPEEVEVQIDPKELRIDVMRASGPGGQSVNTTDSAVRIVHIPTGLTVQCQDEKSQIKNRDKAMRVLKTRLYEKMEAERHAAEAAERKSQVGSGDRSERIRTYNFPQNRLTDHRINLTMYNLDRVVSGDLRPVIEPLMAHHQAALLAEQGHTL